MAKGLDNRYNFNITCKKCNSSNITADEEDGYIRLICLDCVEREKELEKIVKLQEDKNETNDFIKELVLSDDTDELKKSLIKVKTDSVKALTIYKEMADILVGYYKGEEGLVYDNSPFKNELFATAKKLKELYIIYSIDIGLYYKSISLTTYKEPILNNKLDCYELNCYTYDLSIEEDYEILIEDTFNNSNDLIFMSGEIGVLIKDLEKDIDTLNQLIESL